MALTLGVNSGFVTTAPSADPAGTGVTIDGSSVVTKHTSPANAAKITSIGWYRESGTNGANFEVALYSDLAGVPVTRLFVDNTNSTTSNGWVTVAVDWAISASTAYWLAVQMDAHSGSSGIDTAASGGAGYDAQTSQTTLNDPYGGGLVADADGMAAIYALVQLNVTGTGAVIAQSADAAGSGVSKSSGSGNVVAGSADAAGAGVAQWLAAGAVSAQAADAAGVGISKSSGSGNVIAGAADAAGVGVSRSVGGGAPQASAAVVDGDGITKSLGTGAVLAQAAAVDGDGAVTAANVVGSGAVSAQAASVDGDGAVSDSAITGTGDVRASASTISGMGLVEGDQPQSSGGGKFRKRPAWIVPMHPRPYMPIITGSGDVRAGSASVRARGEKKMSARQRAFVAGA